MTFHLHTSHSYTPLTTSQQTFFPNRSIDVHRALSAFSSSNSPQNSTARPSSQSLIQMIHESIIIVTTVIEPSTRKSHHFRLDSTQPKTLQESSGRLRTVNTDVSNAILSFHNVNDFLENRRDAVPQVVRIVLGRQASYIDKEFLPAHVRSSSSANPRAKFICSSSTMPFRRCFKSTMSGKIIRKYRPLWYACVGLSCP